MRILICGLALVVFGCGMSPVLHHDSPQRTNLDVNKVEGNVPHCDFEIKTQGLCGSLTWDHTPVVLQDAPYTLQFWKKGVAIANKGPFVEPQGKVTTDIFMPSMGHGGHGKVSCEESTSTPGVYAAKNVIFIMGGEWRVRIFIKGSPLGDDQAYVSVTLPE